MASLGDLVVKLKADNAHFKRGMKGAESSMASFRRNMVVAGAAAAAGIGAATAVIAGLQNQLRQLDEVAKQSAKLGLLPDKLMGLQHAFTLTGVSVQSGTVALQRMTRRLADAANGAGPAAKTLKELGLNAKELSQLSPDIALGRIATAMMGVKNQADKVRIAFSLFDSEGVGLVNTLADGAEGLRAMQEEWKTLHGGITKEDIEKVERASDAWARFGLLKEGIKNRAAVRLVRISDTLGKAFQGVGLKRIDGGKGGQNFDRFLLERAQERMAAKKAAAAAAQHAKGRDQVKQIALPIKNAIENALTSAKAKAGALGTLFGGLSAQAANATNLRDQRLSFRISEAQRAVNATQPRGQTSPFMSVSERGSAGVARAIMAARGAGSDPAQQERKKHTQLLEQLLEEQRRNTAESLGIDLQEAV